MLKFLVRGDRESRAELLQQLNQLNAALPAPINAVLHNGKVVLNLQKVLMSAEDC